MKMKATVIHKFGDVDVLKREDIERPSPKPGHLLIKASQGGLEVRKSAPLYANWP